jgi:hypothetical protein
MATEWAHQVFVFGVSQAMPGAIVALDIAFPRDDGQQRNPAEPELVGCKLSANGLEPVTHYGAAFSVTEAIRENLEGLGLAQTPGITYWRCSNPEGILASTNHPASEASIGQPWDWMRCLAAISLQSVARPLPS